MFQGPATPEKSEQPVRSNARRPERSYPLKVETNLPFSSSTWSYKLLNGVINLHCRGIRRSKLARARAMDLSRTEERSLLGRDGSTSGWRGDIGTLPSRE